MEGVPDPISTLWTPLDLFADAAIARMAACNARLDWRRIVNVRRSDARGARDQACSGQSRAQARWRRADIDQLPYPPISEFDKSSGMRASSLSSRGKASDEVRQRADPIRPQPVVWEVDGPGSSTKVRWNRSLRAEFIAKGHAVRLVRDGRQSSPRRTRRPRTSPNWAPTPGRNNDPDVIKNRLESPRFNGRTAASLMLDQSFVAGLETTEARYFIRLVCIQNEA